MKILFNQKINTEIKEDYFYSFEVNEGIYLIEIIARAKSWWQNLKSLKALFKKDGIFLNIDNTEIFPIDNKNSNVKEIWNGNELKGLLKTGLIAIFLKKGGHTICLKPKQSPSLEVIKITEVEDLDNNTIIYSSSDNNPPEKGDRRPWIVYILQNLSIKSFSISAKAKKQSRDDEDIKLIIDGIVEENENKNSHQDWYWCGKILKGKEAVFKKELNFEKEKHSIELLADGSPSLNRIEVLVLSKNNNEYQEQTIKPYKDGGVSGDEDYNRYDAIIAEIVAYWNKEFLKDTNPPSELLDPNLVKAIIYQESRVGYYKGANKNIMQIGNPGDPSLKTLRGELKEYWIHNGELILLKYDAKVTTVKDSVNWGVRWLYHKAQGITPDNKRYWKSWQEAVAEYGPPKAEYVNSVWDIYKKGVKKEKNKTIHLWSLIALLAFMSLFSNNSEAYSLEANITKQIAKEENQQIEKIELSYNKDGQFILAQIEWENDWWEGLRVGRNDNKNVSWLTINEPPTDQAILSAKFIDLRGFNNSLLEVYGLTHTSHGFFYIYEIKNNELNLLFKTEAVDFNPDVRWALENYKKYGHGECGEVFADGKLISEYKDINKDGNLDLILSGTKEIICEKRDENFENPVKTKVDSSKIEMKFLWDKDKYTWVL